MSSLSDLPDEVFCHCFSYLFEVKLFYPNGRDAEAVLGPVFTNATNSSGNQTNRRGKRKGIASAPRLVCDRWHYCFAQAMDLELNIGETVEVGKYRPKLVELPWAICTVTATAVKKYLERKQQGEFYLYPDLAAEYLQDQISRNKKTLNLQEQSGYWGTWAARDKQDPRLLRFGGTSLCSAGWESHATVFQNGEEAELLEFSYACPVTINAFAMLFPDKRGDEPGAWEVFNEEGDLLHSVDVFSNHFYCRKKAKLGGGAGNEDGEHHFNDTLHAAELEKYGACFVAPSTTNWMETRKNIWFIFHLKKPSTSRKFYFVFSKKVAKGAIRIKQLSLFGETSGKFSFPSL